MGLPVGLFMLRKGSLWRRAEHGNPETKPFNNIVNPIPEERLWCNYWDKQDLVSYPLRGCSRPIRPTRPDRSWTSRSAPASIRSRRTSATGATTT